MENSSKTKIHIVTPSKPSISGDYYILTLTKEDKIISQEKVVINSMVDFTTVLEELNQYNNENDATYRKLINNPIIN